MAFADFAGVNTPPRPISSYQSDIREHSTGKGCALEHHRVSAIDANDLRAIGKS